MCNVYDTSMAFNNHIIKGFINFELSSKNQTIPKDRCLLKISEEAVFIDVTRNSRVCDVYDTSMLFNNTG